MGNGCGCGETERAHLLRAEVDSSAWDGPAAMSGCASSDTPASCYSAICAGKKAGDPALQDSHALPHHKHPGDPPNASGVSSALSRLPQTQGLTNADAAHAHLVAHMKKINPDYTEGAAMAPAQVRELRRASLNDDRRALSGPAARLEPFRAQWRSAPPQMRDGVMMTRLDGYASVTGIEYEMWDAFGPYGETVDGGAFGKTLAANPDVAFLTNHRGLTMARTLAREGRQPTLLLDADPRGLHCEAWVNQERSDVHDLVLGIDDGNITEMSFGFYITGAEWDEDYEHFRILEVDIHRGDVSAVNYGANPYTDIAARSRTIMSELSHLPAGAQRAAVARLQTALHWRQDTDDEVTALVAGLDATLDQASALVGGDTAGLPDNIAQALALLVAAEEIADELMDKLGIDDPDEAGENELAARRPGASVRARLAHLTRSTTGRSVEYYSSMLDLEGYKERM
jgi:HK97 family phage prohead protease